MSPTRLESVVQRREGRRQRKTERSGMDGRVRKDDQMVVV